MRRRKVGPRCNRVRCRRLRRGGIMMVMMVMVIAEEEEKGNQGKEGG